MENSIADHLHLSKNLDLTNKKKENESTYVSCIKINGKPILPPIISEERRNELLKYKQKAIEIELKLVEQKKKTFNQISSDTCHIPTLHSNRQSTPARPASLNLNRKCSGQIFKLSKSKTEGSINKYSKSLSSDFHFISSQKKARGFRKTIKSTLEQRMAMEDNFIIRNKEHKCQQSPITEEQFTEKTLDSDEDSKTDQGRWSPLKVEPLNALRIQLSNKDLQETDDNLEVSMDESQNTPETVTESPNLMRQNSYTLLTPSPALLSFLESQKIQGNIEKSQSGRKTWDLTEAKKNWNPNDRKFSSPVDDGSSDDFDIQTMNKKNSSSLDIPVSPVTHDDDHIVCSEENSALNDTGTSLEMYSSNKSLSKLPKLKCRLKGKKMKTLKRVPSPKKLDKVPFKEENSTSTQGTPDFVPLRLKDQLSELSDLFLKMKMDHERQKRELEEKQQLELKHLEMIFQKKEAELLSKVKDFPRKPKKSIFSQTSINPTPEQFETSIIGDGNHNRAKNDKANSLDEHYTNRFPHNRRPHSAKDFHHLYAYENECNRRTKSMDLNQGSQDTDLDVSFQDDFMHSRDTTLNNEYIIESDSISNFSSRSSTMSSENKPDLIPVTTLRKFQGISSEEYAKYNQAATVITAAARGFFTRRLLRTAHVQSLITTLRDAINCATQLHGASDIAESDIDLMRRLGRQIEAAWDAVYSVFFNTEISTKLQLIATDRERLKAATAKTPTSNVNKKRISSATRKSLDRKKLGTAMSKSQTSNGCSRVRICSKMAASYPGPYLPRKQK